MMDGPSFSGVKIIQGLAHSIANDPDGPFTQGRAEEIVRVTDLIIERELEGRKILSEALAKLEVQQYE